MIQFKHLKDEKFTSDIEDDPPQMKICQTNVSVIKNLYELYLI